MLVLGDEDYLLVPKVETLCPSREEELASLDVVDTCFLEPDPESRQRIRPNTGEDVVVYCLMIL